MPASAPSGSADYAILDADVVSESSGITDISECLDYQPGSIFLTAGQDGDIIANNQLALLVSPNAVRLIDAYSD